MAKTDMRMATDVFDCLFCVFLEDFTLCRFKKYTLEEVGLSLISFECGHAYATS